MLPLVSLGPICSTCVLSQIRLHFACAKCIPNRSRRLTTLPSILNCWSHKTTKMSPRVSWGKLFLAYVHSQMNPQKYTKFGANRSSRLTAFRYFWICDPLIPRHAPWGIEGRLVFIHRWIRRREPKLVQIGPAVWQLPVTSECLTP